MTMRIRARHYATGDLVDVTTENGCIAAITGAGPPAPEHVAGWIAPALFDLQINGCDGVSFSSAKLTGDEVARVVAVCRRHGLGGLCPTLVTNSAEALLHGFATLRKACEEDATLRRAMPGFHLEGPYISPTDGPR